MMVKKINLSVLFSFCILDVSASACLDTGFHSRHYLGFEKLNQLLLHSYIQTIVPVAMVTHHSRCEIIINKARIKPQKFASKTMKK